MSLCPKDLLVAGIPQHQAATAFLGSRLLSNGVESWWASASRACKHDSCWRHRGRVSCRRHVGVGRVLGRVGHVWKGDGREEVSRGQCRGQSRAGERAAPPSMGVEGGGHGAVKRCGSVSSRRVSRGRREGKRASSGRRIRGREHVWSHGEEACALRGGTTSLGRTAGMRQH